MILTKLNITVMLGGPSAEREVSLRSGAAVAKALRSLGHQVSEVDPQDEHVAPCRNGTDVVFLALHGTYGEDGTVQRRLEELGVPTPAATPRRAGSGSTSADQAALRGGGSSDRAIPAHRFADSTLADGLESAGRAQARPPGFERRPAIRRARLGLEQGAGARRCATIRRLLMEEKIAGREMHRRHPGRPAAAAGRGPAQDRHLRLPDQVHAPARPNIFARRHSTRRRRRGFRRRGWAPSRRLAAAITRGWM